MACYRWVKRQMLGHYLIATVSFSCIITEWIKELSLSGWAIYFVRKCFGNIENRGIYNLACSCTVDKSITLLSCWMLLSCSRCLTWHTGWKFPWNCWIYFMDQSGKEPTFGKRMHIQKAIWKVIGRTFCPSHPGWTSQMFFLPGESDSNSSRLPLGLRNN